MKTGTYVLEHYAIVPADVVTLEGSDLVELIEKVAFVLVHDLALNKRDRDESLARFNRAHLVKRC